MGKNQGEHAHNDGEIAKYERSHNNMTDKQKYDLWVKQCNDSVWLVIDIVIRHLCLVTNNWYFYMVTWLIINPVIRHLFANSKIK